MCVCVCVRQPSLEEWIADANKMLPVYDPPPEGRSLQTENDNIIIYIYI